MAGLAIMIPSAHHAERILFGAYLTRRVDVHRVDVYYPDLEVHERDCNLWSFRTMNSLIWA